MILLLVLAFLLELVAFFSFAAAGLLVHGAFRIPLATVLFVGLMGFWSVYMAPRATKKLAPSRYYVAKTLIYAVSSVMLLRYGIIHGAVFVVLALVDEVLLFRHNLAA